MPKKPTSPTPVTSHTHADTRPNIPTEELRDFIAEDEKKPKTVLYPRDPSLDPQLVWKGKDEQDADDLAVPAVPVYIQEHIKPQAIVELVRAEANKGSAAAADALRRFQRPALRRTGGLLPPRPALDEPHDPGQLAAGDDLAGREGRPQGQGADDLP